MLCAGWSAAYGENALDVGIEQAFAEDAFSHHAGGAEDQNVHGVYRMRQKAERFVRLRDSGAARTEGVVEAFGKTPTGDRRSCGHN